MTSEFRHKTLHTWWSGKTQEFILHDEHNGPRSLFLHVYKKKRRKSESSRRVFSEVNFYFEMPQSFCTGPLFVTTGPGRSPLQPESVPAALPERIPSTRSPRVTELRKATFLASALCLLNVRCSLRGRRRLKLVVMRPKGCGERGRIESSSQFHVLKSIEWSGSVSRSRVGVNNQECLHRRAPLPESSH